MVTYPCRCVMVSHVSSFLSNPWTQNFVQGSPDFPITNLDVKIFTKCLNLFGNPLYWPKNTFQTGSKYDTHVCTSSVCLPWATFLFEVLFFLSDPPLSVVVSDVMGVELFFLTCQWHRWTLLSGTTVPCMIPTHYCLSENTRIELKNQPFFFPTVGPVC